MTPLAVNLGICHRCRRAKGAGPCDGACPCPVDVADILEHASAHECPESRFPARGLGDVVSKLIRVATGGLVKPCRPCKGRQAALNATFPAQPLP